MSSASIRLLIAASGTGGHLFPAIATAEKLSNYHIEWLGVPNRMETQLIEGRYPLHTIAVEGFQQRLGLSTLRIASTLIGSIFQVRTLLKEQKFQGVFSTGGYIAGPAIIAARSLGLPVVLHESNALPGKVTRFFSPWCQMTALGFDRAAEYLPRSNTVTVGTPVRQQFLLDSPLDLPIPDHVPLIAIAGGSQGAVAVNQLVRQCAPTWLESGAWIFHQTGANDPEANSFQHPHYLAMPFYDNMAGLLQRADLAISRAGAGTLTELAVTGTPSILIPYPYAAENHQTFNAAVFADAGAAILCQQGELTVELLEKQVLELIKSPTVLADMAQKAKDLAVPDSGDRIARLLRQLWEN